jgi:transcriptional regulator with XRE-family HTH domain
VAKIPLPEKPIRNVVGRHLKLLRKRFNPSLTQDQLSGRVAKFGVQIDRVAIAKIETGIRGVLDFELEAIAKALDVKIDDLFSPETPPNQSSRRGAKQ